LEQFRTADNSFSTLDLRFGWISLTAFTHRLEKLAARQKSLDSWIAWRTSVVKWLVDEDNGRQRWFTKIPVEKILSRNQIQWPFRF
jgi:hypothetical protein